MYGSEPERRRQDAFLGTAIILGLVSGALSFGVGVLIAAEFVIQTGLVKLHLWGDPPAQGIEKVATFGVIGLPVLTGIFVAIYAFRLIVRIGKSRARGKQRINS